MKKTTKKPIMDKNTTEKTTIELKRPLTVDGAEIKQVQLRRAKVRDLRAVQKASDGSPADSEFRLFANLCELTLSALDEMDASDYRALQEAYEGFLSRR